MRCSACAFRKRLDTCADFGALRESQGPHYAHWHAHHQRRMSFLVCSDAPTHTAQNVKLRLASLPPPKGSLTYDLAISSAPHAPTLVVPQLTAIRTSINSCLDVIDVATWGGDATNANFVSGQLQLLHDHILEAQAALKGYSDVQPPWWENPVDDKVGFPCRTCAGVTDDS